MNWLGKKNGELLGLATFNEFDVFITLDRNLKNQQNLDRFKIILILLIAKNNKHQTLQLFLKKIQDILAMDEIPNFNEIKI